MAENAAAKAVDIAAAEPAGGGLSERVRAEIGNGSLSQAGAAIEIGISDAALSQWLAGKYRGSLEAVEAKIGRWLRERADRREMRAALPDAPAWYQTPAAERIGVVLAWAQTAGDVAVIYGAAGTGKTVTVRRYGTRHPNVWVATMTASTRAWGPCLARVAGACGVRSGHALTWRLEEDLVARLRGAHGLIVVDEAQHLEMRALEGLRGLHDATGAGLALVGNETVYARLTGRREAEYAQLFSRIGKRLRLARPTEGDVRAMTAAWNVCGRHEREALMEIARRPGGLRIATKALRLGTMRAGGEVTAEALKSACRDMGGSI